MTNVNGKYRFNTKVGNVPECVFLYKKLQEETRAFEYRSEIKSYQLSVVKDGDNDGREHYAITEVPDNTGDYDSIVSARNQQRKVSKRNAPCVPPDAGDDGSSSEDRRIVTALWVIRDPSLPPPNKWLAGDLSGYMGITLGHPFLTQEQMENEGVRELVKKTYAFFNSYDSTNISEGKFAGYKPYLPVKDAVFCHNPPASVNGIISYSLNVQWQKEAFKAERSPINGNGLLYMFGHPDIDRPSGYPDWESVFRDYPEPMSATLDAVYQPVAGWDVFDTINSCGNKALDGWWLYMWDAVDTQRIYCNGIGARFRESVDDFVCWQGRLADLGVWEAYMRTMLDYWGVTGDLGAVTRMGTMAKNRLGGGSCASGTGGGYGPDPDPPLDPLIGLATYHGRYCDVVLNHQKNGIVRELTLPIDFPCRVTHIVYEEDAFYNTYYPRESPGQRIEEPHFAEWFSGRVNIDKNNIYVDIIYEIYREYEEGLSIFPNKVMSSAAGDSEWGMETPGLLGRWNNDETVDLECILSLSPNRVYARPVKDKFNKTIRYTINKSSLSITSTEVFEGSHLITSNLFTDNFLEDNTILNISQKPYYENYHTLDNITHDYRNPVVLPPSVDYTGYLGLPTPYFQISSDPRGVYNEVDGGAAGHISLIQPVYSAGIDYTALNASDFLTNKVDWTDTYWVFYLMMERPFINRANTSRLINFLDRCNIKGAGYKKNSNKYYLSYTPAQNYAEISTVAPGFFDFYIEHERMRGYPIIKDGKIVKWLRIASNSFPMFEPGGL
jgi:hypothetical protein